MIKESVKKDPKAGRRIRVMIVLVILLIVMLVWNLYEGSVRISAGEILNILSGASQDMTKRAVIMDIRLPRMMLALLSGGALCVSGFLLQTFFHNPIAGPFVLGISSGAKLSVALVMILFISRGVNVSSPGLILAAMLGSLLTILLVLAASGRVRSMSMLIVCGIMIGYICSSITEIAVTFAEDSNIVNLHNWSMGSFSGASWGQLPWMAGAVLLGTAFVYCLSKPLGAYQMGEAYAESLGVRIKLLRFLIIALSGLLSACVTAFAGPISFVGVAVPHLVRRALKTEKPVWMIPACFLGGAVFCLFSDLAARALFSPAELSISAVTAVLGAPVVIMMMIRRRSG